MSDAILFQPVPPRAPPVAASGASAWLRRNLFSGPASSALTIVTGVLLALVLWSIFRWGVINAVWQPDFLACRALEHGGACWGVIAEKFRLIFFGRFPYDQQWRPLAATLLMLALVAASCYPGFWSRRLFAAWVMGMAVFLLLMRGGLFGLSYVETARWGGFPLTLLLSTVGIALAFPLAVLVALGRRSRLPGIRSICIVYVELIRGVPLISVLFMASFLFPLFMPPGVTIDVLLRVLTGIILFAAAYLAEVVRGGLQIVPSGQLEAATTLGLSYWQTQRKIVLPQALQAVVPAIVNTFIGTFKDTSLVTIVSLYELTGSLQLALGDADWRGFYLEGYFFIAALYFACCFSMSRYSLWIETRLNAGTRRA
jgi:general L-amino acid transport system permease protein